MLPAKTAALLAACVTAGMAMLNTTEVKAVTHSARIALVVKDIGVPFILFQNLMLAVPSTSVTRRPRLVVCISARLTVSSPEIICWRHYHCTHNPVRMRASIGKPEPPQDLPGPYRETRMIRSVCHAKSVY